MYQAFNSVLKLGGAYVFLTLNRPFDSNAYLSGEEIKIVKPYT
jgi:hypothetical protein